MTPEAARASARATARARPLSSTGTGGGAGGGAGAAGAGGASWEALGASLAASGPSGRTWPTRRKPTAARVRWLSPLTRPPSPPRIASLRAARTAAARASRRNGGVITAEHSSFGASCRWPPEGSAAALVAALLAVPAAVAKRIRSGSALAKRPGEAKSSSFSAAVLNASASAAASAAASSSSAARRGAAARATAEGGSGAKAAKAAARARARWRQRRSAPRVTECRESLVREGRGVEILHPSAQANRSAGRRGEGADAAVGARAVA